MSTLGERLAALKGETSAEVDPKGTSQSYYVLESSGRVGDTIRARNRVRGQVKALSAEGRVSMADDVPADGEGASPALHGDTLVVTARFSATSAAVCAMITDMILNRRKTGLVFYDTTMCINGLLSGCVGITAGCAIVEPWAAVVIGVVVSQGVVEGNTHSSRGPIVREIGPLVVEADAENIKALVVIGLVRLGHIG